LQFKNSSFLLLESLKDDKSDVIADAVEAIKDLPLEVIETVTETVVVPEVVVKEIEEVIVEEPVVEEPVVEAEIVEQQTVETEAVEPVVQPTESVPEPIEELPVETVAEAVEEAIVVSENFESQLEDEPAEVPQGIIALASVFSCNNFNNKIILYNFRVLYYASGKGSSPRSGR
jgi:hypothetical protein